jgi:hypothetical protein
MATLALAMAGNGRIRRDEKYTTRYDNINVDEILESDRLRDNYINCVLEKGKCTPEGTELRCEYWILLHANQIFPQLGPTSLGRIHLKFENFSKRRLFQQKAWHIMYYEHFPE